MIKLRAVHKKLSMQRIKIIDIIAVAIIIAALVVMYSHGYKYDLSVSQSVSIDSPWLAKTGSDGTIHVVDSGKMRILKINDGLLTGIISGGAPRGDTFYYADNICIDETGNVYVQETGWSIDGFALDYESILKYDADGNYVETVYFTEYTDVHADKHRLFGLENYNRQLYFVTADETSFTLNALDIDKNYLSEVFTCEMTDAITLIQDFAIDTKTERVYAIDKRGDIFVTDKTGELSLVYSLGLDELNSFESAGKTVMYRGSVSPTGALYVTDIAAGRLLRFSEGEDYRFEHYFYGTQMWNASFAKTTRGDNTLTFVANGSVYVDRTGTGLELEGYSAVQKSGAYMAREGAYDAAVVLFIIACLYAIIRIIALITSLSYSSTQKTAALVVATTVAVSAFLVYGLIGQFQNTYRDELLGKLQMIAQIIGIDLEDKDLDELENPQNFMNEGYKEVWHAMNSVFDSGFGYNNDFYCNIQRYDGTEGYAVAYLDNSIGTYYPLMEDETLSLQHVYETGSSVQSDAATETGAYIYVITPILAPDGSVKGAVSVGSLSYVIEGKISAMVQDIVITMVMIVFALMFLFGEIMSFAELRVQYKLELKHSREQQYNPALQRNGGAVPMHIIRMLVFITFIAFNMATSFLPVYIIRFVTPELGIPGVLANSLPITVNLVFIALTSLVCPRLMSRVGFGKLAVISGVLAMLGDITMATAQNYSMVIIGLGLNGIGVGLITNSIHIFIARLSVDDDEGKGFSIFNAAILSGINCGMLFGSEIAGKLGQSNVFFVSSGAWLIVIIVFIALGKHLTVKNAEDSENKSIMRFVFAPKILKFMLLVQVPYIIVNGFVYYLVPIFGDSHGLSENMVSILIILCSLCSVFLSVSLTRIMQAKFRERSMFISGAIIFVGMLIFAWQMTVLSLVVALLLIGVANSFGPASRTKHFIEMDIVPQYGADRAMGIFDFVDNLGESSGSIIFAGIMSVGFRGGLVGFVAAAAALSGVYMLSSRKK